jgi:hypothetical protein
MQINTELDAGGAGYFLSDDRVMLGNILSVRVTQCVYYAGGHPEAPEVEYGFKGSSGIVWVPESRAGKTKEALLKKL